MTRRARSGRGWDAAPPRASRRRSSSADASREGASPEEAFHQGARDADARDADEASQSPRDQREWAREICLRQLSTRPRTRAELATALTKRGITRDVIAEVLDRYDEVGIIDDASFAQAWIESRHHGKGLARRALGQELRRKGVEQDVIKDALRQLEPETEEVTARELVERKLRTTHGKPDAVFRKLVGMLARKGYPPGVAFRAVKDVLEQHAIEADDQRLYVEAASDWAEALEAEAAEAESDRPDRD